MPENRDIRVHIILLLNCQDRRPPEPSRVTPKAPPSPVAYKLRTPQFVLHRITDYNSDSYRGPRSGPNRYSHSRSPAIGPASTTPDLCQKTTHDSCSSPILLPWNKIDRSRNSLPRRSIISVSSAAQRSPCALPPQRPWPASPQRSRASEPDWPLLSSYSRHSTRTRAGCRSSL